MEVHEGIIIKNPCMQTNPIGKFLFQSLRAVKNMQSEIRQIIYILIPWIMTINFWLLYSHAVFPGHIGTRRTSFISGIFPQINYKM